MERHKVMVWLIIVISLFIVGFNYITFISREHMEQYDRVAQNINANIEQLREKITSLESEATLEHLNAQILVLKLENETLKKQMNLLAQALIQFIQEKESQLAHKPAVKPKRKTLSRQMQKEVDDLVAATKIQLRQNSQASQK